MPIRCPVVLALALALSCAPPSSAPDLEWHQESGYRWRPLVVRGDGPGFASLSARRTGIRFENAVSDSALRGNRLLAEGGGVALGDVDGDGLVDVFLARTEGGNALFRNRGRWRFEDVSAAAGVALADRATTGAVFVDFDGDRDLDLLLLATGAGPTLLLNDGAGRFTPAPDGTGLESGGHGGRTPTFADVDGDGDLDLYIANYKPYSIVDRTPPERRATNAMVRQVAPGRFEIAPEFRDDFKLVVPPGRGGGMFLSMRGEPDDFYRNEGGRLVREPLTSVRFQGPDGRPLAEVPESFGLDAQFADLNGDGAPDLYVANDFEDPDQLWFNDGHGTLRLAGWQVQRQTSNSGMGIAVGDLTGDGLPDLFELDMLSRDPLRRRTQVPTHTPAPKQVGDLITQLQYQRNTLFLNRGDGTFAEIAGYAGVDASGWSWGTTMLDVDLDGWRDLLITTGHAWDRMDGDTQELEQRLQQGGGFARTAPPAYPGLALPNLAFRNRGDSTFADLSATWRFSVDADFSHGMAVGDLDGDGDLDVVINRLRAPALVLRNDAPAPRIAVRLVGDAPNTAAIGAIVTVRGGPVPIQRWEVTAGGLYLSHSDTYGVFATGDADSVTIEVRWRDGRRTLLTAARPNRLYEIRTATATASTDSAGPTPGTPLFADVTAMLGGHVHRDGDYDDWSRQALLPMALSRLGPGVAWYDLEGDGDEDLIVGAGSGGRLAVFRNEGRGGRLVPDPAPPGAAPLPEDLTTVLGFTAAPGDRRLIVGLSNWEARSATDATRIPAVLIGPVPRRGRSVGAQALVPPQESATGPLALGDVDGDGDLDLFVGGRAVPGRYPEPATSLIYRNDGGTFRPDPVNGALLRGIGMVSSAMFADLDGDGDADLVLAREWGSLVLLMNQGAGRLVRAEGAWGLEGLTGRWNGLAAGDLDGDGRLDLVVTSWGRNTGLDVHADRPLVVRYGRFGPVGETEPIVLQADSARGTLHPIEGYPRLRTGIARLVERVPTFNAFAAASVDQLIGTTSGGGDQLEAATLDHVILFNRGGRFEVRPLPGEAQLAPAFQADIADFDGDGAEDLFLTQNFSATPPDVPRFDAGRSLLLRGDGRGALHPISGPASGLLVYGDGRGAAHADYDGDGRLDLAVSQEGAATRLFHNQGAAPGLRVRLIGAGANPEAIGAQLRVDYGARLGPVREIQAGAGYWSQHGAVQVMGLAGTPLNLWVRWPGGREVRVPVPTGAREVVVRQ